MADRYWVGGSGNWDATSTTNWASSSGGASGASAPTSVDNVIFDNNSNVGTGAFTVTVTGTSASPSNCQDFSTSSLDGAMTLTMGATAVINCYGNFTTPASNFSTSGVNGAIINFVATTTGFTVTTNGVSFSNIFFNFNGTGGGWTLGSALTCNVLYTNAGTFNSGNFNITTSVLTRNNSNNNATVNLGSSTITLNAAAPFTYLTSGLTFNAGTSTINCSNASPTFAGNGLTFYNVGFTSTAIGTVTITGANTYNNLSFTARAAAGIGFVNFDAGVTNTVNGTLTLGSGTTGVARLLLRSNALGIATTLSVATLTAITDIDFRDIIAAGASSPWSGTRIGNCLGNSNITFTAARTVYWVFAASANWSGAVWNTTSGNTGGATTNFPLAQDSIIIDNAGLTAGNTITINAAYQIPNLSFATRSTAATFATGTASPVFYGDLIYSSSVTPTGTGLFTFAKQSSTATITSAGITFTQPISINAASGTVRINGNLTLGSTLTFTLNQGTLDLTNNGAGNYTLSTGLFSSSNSNTRAITFGTGNITLTGSGTTIWTTAIVTNFSYTGTPTVNCTYSGSTGTRTVTNGSTGGAESNAISFNVSAGSDTFTVSSATTQSLKNLNFTGFTGTFSNTVRVIYGNLTLSSSMTLTAGASATTFAATSGTQQITTNGNATIDFPIIQNGVGGTVQLQDALTIGSTRAFTLTNGTLNLNNLTLTTGIFSSSNSNIRAIAFGTGNITLTGNSATIWNTSTSNNFSYTGTPTVNSIYSGSTGARIISTAIIANGGVEANAVNFNISAGSDTLTFSTGRNVKNINFTGFTGTVTTLFLNIYGNLTITAGLTLTATAFATTFAGTSGTQQITTAGQTLDFPLIFNGIGGTFAFQDALTMGSTRTLTLSAGTLLLKSGTTNTVGDIVLSGNSATNTKLGATTPGFQAFLQKVIGGVISASSITVQDSSVTPVDTWYGDPSAVDGGNNTNWEFLAVSAAGHDAFLPQEIRHFKDLDRKSKAAEAARVRAAKLMAYKRKLKFKELFAPELISRQEEIEYQKLIEQQFPEEVAQQKAKEAADEVVKQQKAKVEAQKRELKQELKRLQKEEKEAAEKVAKLQREKELLIDSVIARQKAMEIQAQLAVIYKLQQEEMEDEQALLLLI